MIPSNHGEAKSTSMTLVIVLCLWALVAVEVSAFSLHNPLAHTAHRSSPSSKHARSIPIAGVTASHASKSENSDEWDSDDAKLLKTVKKQQLVELCEPLGLSTKGKKEDLLKRLRQYAEEEARAIKEHNKARVARVEDRMENPNGRERFEIVESYDDDDDDDDDDSEDYFYLPIESLLPSPSQKGAEGEANSKGAQTPNVERTSSDDNQTGQRQRSRPLTSSEITAPPPPLHIEPNENGERVVTVYSSSDMNDLTGVAAAQPGQAAVSSSNDAMMSSSSSQSMDGEHQPWEMPSEKKTTAEEDQEKQRMTELVQTLLLLSGAPAFREFDYDLAGLSTLNLHVPNDFVGFDPSSVPAELWSKYEGNFRSQEGMNLLHDVLRETELYAIGQDGMAGDNPDKGGGHFREVNKVRAFLEGYGRAQIRKSARETLTMLLDKLASEGLEGLDLTLASMTRRGDSSSASSTGAELSDSLLQYLNDAIRQQERKVQRVQASQAGKEQHHVEKDQDHDPLEGLWKVKDVKADKNRGGDDDDDMIEATLDPKDPVVKKILTVEYNKLAQEEELQQSDYQVPNSGPEQLLLLLTLLRERIKTEAAFVPDERGRNLRLLAYCLKCPNAMDRESLITSQLGTAIDRYDSFAELVASAIEYAESTSSQLQPAKTRDKFPVLNLPSLKSILRLTKDIREQQAWKASGATPSGNTGNPTI